MEHFPINFITETQWRNSSHSDWRSVYQTHIKNRSKKFTIATKDNLVPMQYGLGVSSGTEIVTHALQNYLDLFNPSNDQAILSLDIKNAYNSIKRSHIYDRISVFTPSFLHFYNWRYGSRTTLISSNGTQLGFCSEGVSQGDPWATGLFISGLHTLAQ